MRRRKESVSASGARRSSSTIPGSGLISASPLSDLKRRVALFRRQPSDCLHEAEEGERVGIGRQALLLDNPRERLDLGKPAFQALAREHAAPLGEAVGAERRVKQNTAGGEQAPQAIEARDRIGK